MKRRNFLAAATATAAICTTQTRYVHGQAPQSSAVANPVFPPNLMWKTLKIGMVGGEAKSLVDKFRIAKEAGFDGIEMDSPGFDVEEAKRAMAATGLPIDGSVCSSHWGIRHTSPDPAVRATALAHLEQAIRDTHAVGGHTVLLVVGKGEDGKEEEIIPRSQANIALAIPTAARFGVTIAIENVWNQMLYDHDGGNDQTADRFVKYVDAFNSPWVGMQFDIGNHWRYGDPAAWIRTLGKRIVKLDAKGFSREKNSFSRTMTDCDLDWASVREALREIGYTGWIAAEVGGGDSARLAEISKDMDLAFELKG
ncbi:sugar phosphate isomerase/epimerase family protein [Planctomycetaceae bacterium SH139]